jgi:dTDP-4-amino-4,6-dideoxygalactose transaminase
MKVPFADLTLQYQHLKTEIDLAIASVIQKTAFIGGRNNEFVLEFEEAYCHWMGIKNTIGCANGTDAIEVILEAWGIGIGDEVIVPALSWFSTAEAVINRGAKPVFIDVVFETSNIDTALIEAKINANTKAIIPVHLYGQMADMEKVMEIANRYGLKVLEDCAQAHGAERLNRKAGTWGHAASFSFYPGKNLGAYGDAGAICTNDDNLAEICRQICNHGQKEKHNHLRSGRNSRLDGIQAAILSVKLPHIDQWNELRFQLAQQYIGALQNMPQIKLPRPQNDNKHIYHLMVVHHPYRSQLANHLKENGIETALHYPYPLSSLQATSKFVTSTNNFPVALSLCNTLLSIPIFPEMKESELTYVVNNILSFSQND